MRGVMHGRNNAHQRRWRSSYFRRNAILSAVLASGACYLYATLSTWRSKCATSTRRGAPLDRRAEVAACFSTPHEAPAEDQLPGAAEELQTSPQPQRFYRLHLGAGASKVGEVHLLADGLVQADAPERWEVRCKKKWDDIQGWRTTGQLQVGSEEGLTASVRGSMPLLSPDMLDEAFRDDKSSRAPEGAGLDVNVEAVVKAPRHRKSASSSAVGRMPMGDDAASVEEVIEAEDGEPDFVVRPSVELCLGPGGQRKYFNFSLPFGIRLGVTSPSEQVQKAPTQEAPAPDAYGLHFPADVYLQLHFGTEPDLEGWTADTQVGDRHVGVVHGSILRPWKREDGPTQWGVEHSKGWGAIMIPRSVVDWAYDVFDSGSRALNSYAPRALRGAQPAVLPSHRIGTGSDGHSATVGLQSAQAGFGVPGWQGTMQVNKHGWGSSLRLTFGSQDAQVGAGRYRVSANGMWGERPTLSHDLSWTNYDGEGVTFKVAKDPETGKRKCNFGMEFIPR